MSYKLDRELAPAMAALAAHAAEAARPARGDWQAVRTAGAPARRVLSWRTLTV
jgi:hypothetical protein